MIFQTKFSNQFNLKMKKIKLMSLMTVVLLVLGFASTHAQQSPVTTLTRYPCIPGYLGCVADQVNVTVASNATGSSSTTQLFGPTTFLSFFAFQKYIKVNGSPYFALPTSSANPILVINPTDGIFPYTVVVTLTTSRTYTIGVSRVVE